MRGSSLSRFCSSEHLEVTPSLNSGLARLSRINLFSLSHTLSLSCSQVDSSDSHSSQELPTQVGYSGLGPCSSGSEEGIQELFQVGVHSQGNPPRRELQSLAQITGNVKF